MHYKEWKTFGVILWLIGFIFAWIYYGWKLPVIIMVMSWGKSIVESSPYDYLYGNKKYFTQKNKSKEEILN